MFDKDVYDVFAYEVNQWYAGIFFLSPEGFQLLCSKNLVNAVVESTVLHTRILADIFLSKKIDDDDIVLTDLTKVTPEIQLTVDKLKIDYGHRKKIGSPCWAFNKMLAHATKKRSKSYDYVPHINKLKPHLEKLISSIESPENQV